jgi:hypothetical protein
VPSATGSPAVGFSAALRSNALADWFEYKGAT